MAVAAAAIDSLFGFIIAWVLARYRFPGKGLLDAVIDLPFALPTAVAGIALSTLYAPNGWVGSLLIQHGIRIAYTPWGVLVAMTFIGLPFTVRTLQPVLSELGLEVEEVAATLGATRLQTIARVVLPMLAPAILTGAAMAFARGVGEYGSIIFIAGNIPAVSEIAPLLIVTKLEQYDYAGASAIGVVMLAERLASVASELRRKSVPIIAGGLAVVLGVGLVTNYRRIDHSQPARSRRHLPRYLGPPRQGGGLGPRLQFPQSGQRALPGHRGRP